MFEIIPAQLPTTLAQQWKNLDAQYSRYGLLVGNASDGVK